VVASYFGTILVIEWTHLWLVAMGLSLCPARPMYFITTLKRKEGSAMLVAKMLSAKSLEQLEGALNEFLGGEEGAKVQSVSGVSVIPHPTIGAATYAVVVTYQK
jgi:hypothetical protein